MAKVTIADGTVFEGSNEELMALFKQMGVKFPEDEKAEPAPKEEPLKVGDYAKVLSKSYILDVGDVVNIKETGCVYDFIVERISDGKGAAFDICHLTKATEEEIEAFKAKESQRKLEESWAKIGRKVNEFKKGDIISTKYYGILEVVKVDSFGAHPIHVVINKKDDAMTTKSCTLVTPVEARFDR